MSNEELKGLLLIGEDIEYQGFLIRNYKLGEIFKGLKLDKYNYLLSFAILDVKDVIKDSKINIDKLKMYDIVCEIPEFTNWFIEILNTFTYLEWEQGMFRDFVSYEGKKRVRFTEDKFDGFMDIFKKMYCVNRGSKSKSKFDPSKAVDEETKKLVEEFAEEEKKIRDKNKIKQSSITLMSIINGLSVKPNSYTLLNIWKLTVYQLMMQYYATEQSDNYDNILNSIYAGIYDMKKNKINLESLHWANEIDI